MSNSLRDQLLKAGLATQEQVDKAEQSKQRHAAGKPSAAKHANKTKQASRQRPKTTPPKPQPTQEEIDLAKLYQARESLERAEKAEEERLKREAAARKKRTRKQIRDLIMANTLNTEEGDIRYNFVVGETVKYLYVTAEQQTQLAAGTLAITFMDGKRCLITPEIGQQIHLLDPDKIVVIADPNSAQDIDEFEIPLESESELKGKQNSNPPTTSITNGEDNAPNA